ncbi:Uncharacterised protein [Bordetella pertussis]|nr:Uncharacterised protein [Bordetella pertussis]CPL87953.1 Uncharacterised protein [Bordetella pertussis]CRD72751.1 Uncharacterised protein [Bordetella pertussis]
MRTAGQAHRRRGRRGQGMRARVIDTVARGRRRRDGRNLRRVLLAAALRRLRTFIAALSLGRLRTRVVAALGKLRVPVATVATVSGGRRRALPLIPAALGRLLFPIAIVPRRLRIRIAAVPGRRRPVLATVRRRLGTRLAFLPRWLASAVRIQASSRRFATPPRIGHTGVRPLAFRGRHRILARPTRYAGRRRTRSGRHAGVGTRARTGIRSGRRPADLSYTGQPIFMRAPPHAGVMSARRLRHTWTDADDGRGWVVLVARPRRSLGNGARTWLRNRRRRRRRRCQRARRGLLKAALEILQRHASRQNQLQLVVRQQRRELKRPCRGRRKCPHTRSQQGKRKGTHRTAARCCSIHISVNVHRFWSQGD